MPNLVELTENLAAATVGADPTDLPALAGLHTQFQELAKEAAQVGGATRLTSTAQRAEKIVEGIILREIDDAAKGLEDVAKAVAELQKLAQQAIDGTLPQDTQEEHPTPSAEQPTPTTSTATAAPTPDSEADSLSAPQTISADDAPLVVEFIGEARGHIEAGEAGLLQVEEHPDDLEAINGIFRSFHTIKGVAGFLNLKQIGKLAHAAENLLDLGRKSQLKLVGGAVDVILEAIDLMKAMINDLEECVKTNRPTTPQVGLPGLLKRLEAATKGEAVSSAPATATATENAELQPAAKPSGERAAGAATTADATVKVATSRLDSLIDMVGELVIAESMVQQDVKSLVGESHRLERNVSHLGKITRTLQELSMAMRMVPIQGVFQKMARLARDLARKACKDIELVMTGGETELDRNVVEAIGDPLVHMVRNSIDHGAEMPDVRKAAGKSPTARVELKAFHQGGSIFIQISDDGRGLNKGKILKKAMENGLVREGQELSEPEIFALIFAAGLSTAEKITDVSGRGVGMDVVKRNIEALRGRIEIASVEGQGTTFTIKLPLTLAVIDGLVVQVGPQRYILPLTSIEQSLRPTPEMLSTVQNRGEMIMVRGQLLPLFRLHRMFAVTPRTEDPTDALVVVVQDNQRRCGLLVDELLGQQQVVIKSLGEAVGKIKGVSGGAILGDGNVSLILDVPGLIESATSH